VVLVGADNGCGRGGVARWLMSCLVLVIIVSL
jgi:hypothetical protein